MNRIYKFVIALSVASFACMGLTACDDDKKTSGTSNQFVIGNDG